MSPETKWVTKSEVDDWPTYICGDCGEHVCRPAHRPVTECPNCGGQRIITRESKRSTAYDLVCDHPTCGTKWIAREPQAGWQVIRCPSCTKSISAAMWEAKRALSFVPTP